MEMTERAKIFSELKSRYDKAEVYRLGTELVVAISLPTFCTFQLPYKISEEYEIYKVGMGYIPIFGGKGKIKLFIRKKKTS